MTIFDSDTARQQLLTHAYVACESSRCVQCGVCSFRCPMEIDVRRYVWRGERVLDPRCIACGACVDNCPRGLLHFEVD